MPCDGTNLAANRLPETDGILIATLRILGTSSLIGGILMPYMLVLTLTVTVNYLLLLSVAGVCGKLPRLSSLLLAAFFGGVYGLICLLPGCSLLGSMLCRLISLMLTGILAFGVYQIRCFAAFGLLSLVLDGAISDTGERGIALCICLLLLMWLGRGKPGLVPVELHYKERKIRIKALRDTGNLLRDPITDSPVLVIGAEAAQKLTGLTPGQLKNPLETMGQLPGLRLIPYRAVGTSGFLLALKLEHVRIGPWQGSRVVAFAPEGLGENGQYEALTGGTV